MSVILDSRQRGIVRISFAIGMVALMVMNFLLIRQWTPRGGCDGGLCAIATLAQLFYSAAAWFFSLMALVTAWTRSKAVPKAKFTAPIVLCILSLIVSLAAFVLMGGDDFSYVVLPVCWPPMLYAALLLGVCLIARYALIRWEDLNEEDLLR